MISRNIVKIDLKSLKASLFTKVLFITQLLFSLPLFGQKDSVGSGHALRFNGITDYLDAGNVYDDLALPISISAWIKLDAPASYLYPIFNSQDNLPIYNGITFTVSTTSISIQYGDGRGEGNSAFRRGKGAFIQDITGRWVHVAANMRNASDMDLFLNGVNVGGFYDGSSSLPMSSASPADDAKIGYWSSNGGTYFFNGEMDEVKLWNRSLSENEIRTQMCKKLTGNEPGLIGYWTFDETSGDAVFDKSPNHFDGTLQGNPQRVYSGAPIGDESKFLYPVSWSGNSLSFQDGTYSVTVSGVTNTPPGVHIYEVKNIPSQTSGLDLNQINEPYFGIFTASVNGMASFNLTEEIQGVSTCTIFSRTDNSVADWQEQANGNNIQSRIEIIGASPTSDFALDLGDDRILCDQSSSEIHSNIDPTGKSFKWNTGEVTPLIVVNQSGAYILEVMEGCTKQADTVTVLFMTTPSAANYLGDDKVLCSLKPIELKPFDDPSGYFFTWQDDSNSTSHLVTEFGKYWVRIENYCGVTSDTVEFRKPESDFNNVPNVITPNDDPLNQNFQIDNDLVGSYFAVFNRWGKEVYRDESYQNNWDARGIDSGVYFYFMRDLCLKEFKGTITVVK